MELKELNTVAFAPGLSTHFAASWSEDNKLFILTAKGIHIFELIPNPKHSKCFINIKRFWLKVPEIKPTKNAGVDTSKLILNLPQPFVYEMVMDSSLVPDLPFAKTPSPIHIVQASWSPAGLLHNCRCILAVVLSTGAVLLYGPHSWKWVIVCNLSQMWHNCCEEDWSQISSKEAVTEQFDKLKERTMSLKMTMVVWGEMVQGSCKLAAVHSNSTISVWKITAMNVTEWDQANVELLTTVKTNMNVLTALHCLPVGTIVGDVDGKISLFPDIFKELPDECSTPSPLWNEEDQMRITAISSLPQSMDYKSAGKWIILAIKKAFLIVFLLDNSGHKLAEHVQRVGGLAISGFVPISTTEVIVASHTGTICKLDITINESKQIVVETENIAMDFKMKDMACYSISCCKKQRIWTVITSICKMYDHLVLRKPSHLIFCTLFPDDSISSCLTSDSANTLVDTGEYFEIIRVNYLKNKTIPTLQDNHRQLKLDSQFKFELQMSWWLAKIKMMLLLNSGDEDKEQQFELVEEYFKEVEKAIQIVHACNALKNLKSVAATRSLSVHEELSSYLLDTWLRISVLTAFDFNLSVISEVLKELSPVIDHKGEEEKCIICGQDFPITDNYRSSTCSDGHKVTRCCISLRQCVQPPYYRCPTPGCCALAHEDIAAVNVSPVCIYCGAILQLDDRVGGLCKVTPNEYHIKPDLSNVKTESVKNTSERALSKTKYLTEDVLIKKQTYVIQMKDGPSVPLKEALKN